MSQDPVDSTQQCGILVYASDPITIDPVHDIGLGLAKGSREDSNEDILYIRNILHLLISSMIPYTNFSIEENTAGIFKDVYDNKYKFIIKYTILLNHLKLNNVGICVKLPSDVVKKSFISVCDVNKLKILVVNFISAVKSYSDWDYDRYHKLVSIVFVDTVKDNLYRIRNFAKKLISKNAVVDYVYSGTLLLYFNDYLFTQMTDVDPTATGRPSPRVRQWLGVKKYLTFDGKIDYNAELKVRLDFANTYTHTNTTHTNTTHTNTTHTNNEDNFTYRIQFKTGNILDKIGIKKDRLVDHDIYHKISIAINFDYST